MELIEKIESEATELGQFEKKVNNIIKKITKIAKILEGNGLTNCVIRPTGMSKGLVYSILIDSDGCTHFEFADKDEHKDLNTTNTLSNLFSFLEQIRFNEIKNIERILSDENSFFELN